MLRELWTVEVRGQSASHRPAKAVPSCPKCFTLLSEGATVCPNCGSRPEPAAPTSAAASPVVPASPGPSPDLLTESFDLSPLLFPGRHASEAEFALRITVDSREVRIERPDARILSLRWDDPGLGFSLIDYRLAVAAKERLSIPRQARRTPQQLCPWPYDAPSALRSREPAVWITREAFESLRSAGFAAQLHVSTEEYGRSAAVRTIFDRRPPRPARAPAPGAAE